MASTSALALLHVTFPDGSEQTVAVGRTPFNIGRAPESDLPLAGPEVSRQHARLLFQAGEVVLIDLNSSSGTWVGDRRLEAGDPCAIAFGQPFRIGPYTLRLEPAAAPTAAPVPERRDRPSRQAAAAPPPSPPPPPPPEPPEGGQVPYDQAIGLPGDCSRYLQYLPPIYAADPFLGRFLLAFEGVLAPIEQAVDHFDLYLSPRTAPRFFLEQLAQWLGVTLDEKWPTAKRRAILAEAAELYRRRGTRWSLSRHIEIYAGVAPEIVEPEDRPFHFRVILRLPGGQAIDQAAIERIVQAHKPAHTTYELEIVHTT